MEHPTQARTAAASNGVQKFDPEPAYLPTQGDHLTLTPFSRPRMTAEDEATERACLIRDAMTWLHTPFRHMGDVKGAGVDCCMLLIRCFCDLGILPPFDPRPYAQAWHMHRSEERYLAWMGRIASPTDSPQAGDVAVFKYGRVHSHAGIIIAADGRRMVHAWAPDGEVTLSDGFEVDFTVRSVLYFDAWARMRHEVP